MAHFYGTLQGGGKQLTQIGTKNSGMLATVASWEGAVRCFAYHDEKTGKDMVECEKIKWEGAGENKLLHKGLIGKSEEKLKESVG